jgi:hypothetical protein
MTHAAFPLHVMTAGVALGHVLMSDHAGGQADSRSRRCAGEIGGQKGRHIPHFFQSRTPAQQIAAHPTLSP